MNPVRRIFNTEHNTWRILILIRILCILAILSGVLFGFAVKKVIAPSSQQLVHRPALRTFNLSSSSLVVTGPYEIFPRRAVDHHSVSQHPVRRALRMRPRCQTDCSRP